MLNRRTTLKLFVASLMMPKQAFAKSPREITWDDLLPPGVPYSEIIGEGDMDEANGFWDPVYDANAVKLNEDLDGRYVKMAGYIAPFDVSPEGVKDFMLVPYVGACIHTPPPPANQLVVVSSATPWPSHKLWNPIWVTGLLRTQLQSTSLGQTGYSIAADELEDYEW